MNFPVFRQLADKKAYQFRHLGLRCMVVFPYAVKQGVYHKHDGTVNEFVDYFALDAIEQILKAAVIAVLETLYGKYHIPYRHDHHMGSDCIITRAVTFCPQLQVAFGEFEISLNVQRSVYASRISFSDRYISVHTKHTQSLRLL